MILIWIPLNCDPMTSDWIMVLFFPSKKSHETSRNLWSHISLYPMIMGYIQSSPKKSHDYPQKKPMIIPWSKPMILVFHLCPGSQVNDSFSHDRRDVMELIEAVLSGQVHPAPDPIDSGGVAPRRDGDGNPVGTSPRNMVICCLFCWD